MPVDLSIKGLPDALVEALRRRAAQHNRTVDQEVVGILEAGLSEAPNRTFTEFVARQRARGLHTPDEAAAMIREDRDAGHRD